MEVRRFFSESPVIQQTITITGEEHHHIRKVNRLGPGDPIEIIDGRGRLYTGRIGVTDRHQVKVDVRDTETEERPPLRTIMAPSLLKTKAMNLLVEKLTELGVDQIRPVLYTRTDVDHGIAALKRWQRIAAQSLKVNKRLWLTDIHAPVTLQELLSGSAGPEIKSRILLDLEGKRRFELDSEGPVLCLVGPPGDFTGEERELIARYDFIPSRISDYTLKTETAAIAAAALLEALLPTFSC